ncbi:hypothetical protein FLA4_11180 [Candidatus Rickettsia kotlanii]|nr:hypothetical protein FLA4_11180 [Candidatus Rickettsia kotlanii]BDU61950.1 hypothetical protein HM2_11180 [Candidatus Rickettsia kotlanii]
MNTVDIRLRVSADIKIEAAEIFKQIGLTISNNTKEMFNKLGT